MKFLLTVLMEQQTVTNPAVIHGLCAMTKHRRGMKPVLTLVLIPKERRPGSIVQLLHSVVQYIAGNIERDVLMNQLKHVRVPITKQVETHIE